MFGSAKGSHNSPSLIDIINGESNREMLITPEEMAEERCNLADTRISKCSGSSTVPSFGEIPTRVE